MPQYDNHIACFGCRAKCKGQDPCAQGAEITQCAACSFLTQEQWTHLRENFAKRSASRSKLSSQQDILDEIEDDQELVFTGQSLSPDTEDQLLDNDPDDAGFFSTPVIPVSGISPLPPPAPAFTSTASLEVSAGSVQPTATNPVFFKTPAPPQPPAMQLSTSQPPLATPGTL